MTVLFMRYSRVGVSHAVPLVHARGVLSLPAFVSRGLFGRAAFRPDLWRLSPMSFSSDRAALDALCAAMFKHGLTLDVCFQDAEVIAEGLTDAAAVFEAASATSDPVVLWLHEGVYRRGWFLLLMQDDPDCLVVDHSANKFCQSIFDEWFSVAEAV